MTAVEGITSQPPAARPLAAVAWRLVSVVKHLGRVVVGLLHPEGLSLVRTRRPAARSIPRRQPVRRIRRV